MLLGNYFGSLIALWDLHLQSHGGRVGQGDSRAHQWHGGNVSTSSTIWILERLCQDLRCQGDFLLVPALWQPPLTLWEDYGLHDGLFKGGPVLPCLLCEGTWTSHWCSWTQCGRSEPDQGLGHGRYHHVEHSGIETWATLGHLTYFCWSLLWVVASGQFLQPQLWTVLHWLTGCRGVRQTNYLCLECFIWASHCCYTTGSWLPSTSWGILWHCWLSAWEDDPTSAILDIQLNLHSLTPLPCLVSRRKIFWFTCSWWLGLLRGDATLHAGETTCMCLWMLRRCW